MPNGVANLHPVADIQGLVFLMSHGAPSPLRCQRSGAPLRSELKCPLKTQAENERTGRISRAHLLVIRPWTRESSLRASSGLLICHMGIETPLPGSFDLHLIGKYVESTLPENQGC